MNDSDHDRWENNYESPTMARAGAVCEIVLNMRREESRPSRLDLHIERSKVVLHYLTVFL